MTADTTAAAVIGGTLRRDWRTRAACLGSDPELFFPAAETGPAYDAQVAAAKAVCAAARSARSAWPRPCPGSHMGSPGG
jgi:hypothetical protein